MIQNRFKIRKTILTQSLTDHKVFVNMPDHNIGAKMPTLRMLLYTNVNLFLLHSLLLPLCFTKENRLKFHISTKSVKL